MEKTKGKQAKSKPEHAKTTENTRISAFLHRKYRKLLGKLMKSKPEHVKSKDN